MNSIYNLRDGETEPQYIYRLGLAKDSGLIHDTWPTLAEIINAAFDKSEGEKLGDSAYRKKYANYKEAVEAGILKDGNTKLDELRNERIKLQTLNIERSRYDREESRHSLFYEYVKDVIDTLPLPQFNPLFPENKVEDINTNYLVCIADIHYGAKFKSYNNEYSPEVAKERLELLAGDIIDFVNKKQLHRIHIAELGDTIQGILRVSDLKLNDSSVVKAVVDISRLLAMFLNDISKYVNIEYYHVGTSNHSQTRPLGSKANQLADEDMEYVIGNYISDLLANNNRVNVHLVENGQNFIDIEGLGFSVVAAHGHQFANLDNAIRDISIMRQTFVDYMIVGHYHNAKNIDVAEGCCHNLELLCCPSFVGSDPYSDSLLRGSKAAVNVYGFNELYGHTETYRIILN